jgi:hypothetical protein
LTVWDAVRSLAFFLFDYRKSVRTETSDNQTGAHPEQTRNRNEDDRVDDQDMAAALARLAREVGTGMGVRYNATTPADSPSNTSLQEDDTGAGYGIYSVVCRTAKKVRVELL